MKENTKIKLEIDPVTTLTLCGRNALNFLNIDTIAELSEKLTFLASNEEIAVLIITGQGEKAFCSGADIKELALMKPENVENYVKKGTTTFQQLEDFPVPVIAVVNGFAFGAGFELLLACDIRFMAEQTKVGQPAVKHGLIPPFGGTHRLPLIVGSGKAREIIFSGMDLSAAECLAAGLANRVYPGEILLNEAIKFAGEIVKNKKYAVSLAKQLMNLQVKTRNAKLEDKILVDCLKNESTKKQLKTFFEKTKSAEILKQKGK